MSIDTHAAAQLHRNIEELRGELQLAQGKALAYKEANESLHKWQKLRDEQVDRLRVENQTLRVDVERHLTGKTYPYPDVTTVGELARDIVASIVDEGEGMHDRILDLFGLHGGVEVSDPWKFRADLCGILRDVYLVGKREALKLKLKPAPTKKRRFRLDLVNRREDIPGRPHEFTAEPGKPVFLLVLRSRTRQFSLGVSGSVDATDMWKGFERAGIKGNVHTVELFEGVEFEAFELVPDEPLDLVR